MTETLMEYDQVRWLRSQTIQAATGMGTAPDPRDLPGTDLLAPARVPAAAFGNSTAGGLCHTAWRDVLDQATTANRNMRDALQVDASRLDEVISCFEERDHESADEICAAGNSVTVLSAHLHSNDSVSATPEWDDYLRATQHDRLVDYATNRSGAVIAGMDANVSVDRTGDGEGGGELAEYDAGPLAPEAVARFEEEGFANVGDFSHGDTGVGTSSSDKSIDYIWSRGPLAGSPQEVDGGPSDHDGQIVTHRLAGW